MKIRISVEGKSISAEVGDMAEGLFVKLASELLSSISKRGEIEFTNRRAAMNSDAPKMVQHAEDTIRTNDGMFTYKGFIQWKCKDCGNVRAFCLKKESKGVHCMSCNSDHLFEEPLKPIYAQCECGKSFKYMTNMDEETFDMNCIDCGSPIPIKWNEKKGIYETIRD